MKLTGAAVDEVLLGAADIQSLADLANSLDIVRTMRSLLITREVTVVLVAAVVAPLVPLALTMMALTELLKKVVGILL